MRKIISEGHTFGLELIAVGKLIFGALIPHLEVAQRAFVGNPARIDDGRSTFYARTGKATRTINARL